MDYKRRTGEHPDGPAWATLTYSVVAYENAVHEKTASGTGSIFIKGFHPATYSMIMLDHPDSIKHALVEAILTNKDGGFYAAEWDLEWTPAGWQNRVSITPTSAVKARVPSEVK